MKIIGKIIFYGSRVAYPIWGFLGAMVLTLYYTGADDKIFMPPNRINSEFEAFWILAWCLSMTFIFWFKPKFLKKHLTKIFWLSNIIIIISLINLILAGGDSLYIPTNYEILAERYNIPASQFTFYIEILRLGKDFLYNLLWLFGLRSFFKGKYEL